jgi:4-azaleucine resistance transporter AzlC
MKPVYKQAFAATIPVMAGYLILGFGFGIIIKANGFPIALAAAMSTFIYAGSMQYAAIGLLTGGASLVTTALTTLMVNIRHLFYGISMLEQYEPTGKAKPYLIFALTDETYSLVCTDLARIPEADRSRYALAVSLLNHLYWIAGSVAGAVAGALVSFNSQGIDFALTALFLTVFTEQWLSAKSHGPALIGVGATLLSLLVFGKEHFLIPAMGVIALLLYWYKEEAND